MSEQPPTPPESSPAVPPAATPPADPPQVFDAQMFPPRRRPWVQFLLDHNPALLLSTVLMLLGCYLLNGTIDGSAGAAASDRLQLLSLLGVINLYEACIIPLGLVLIRRRRGAVAGKGSGNGVVVAGKADLFQGGRRWRTTRRWCSC